MRSDGVQTTYLWSYNRQYPVLEIKNASYQQVYDALGRSAVNAIENYDGKVPTCRIFKPMAPFFAVACRIPEFRYTPISRWSDAQYNRPFRSNDVL